MGCKNERINLGYLANGKEQFSNKVHYGIVMMMCWQKAVAHCHWAASWENIALSTTCQAINQDARSEMHYMPWLQHYKLK